MQQQRDPEVRVGQVLKERESELFHHPSGCRVLRRRDADEAANAEIDENPFETGAPGLGREPTSPAPRIEAPTKLRVRRPEAVELRSSAPDQPSALAVLDREQAEAVLGPVPL